MNFPTSVTTFQVHSTFPTSARTFQLRRNFPTSAKLSNSKRSFPTSLGSFQLCSVLSNSFCSFQRQTFQLKLSNFSFFPTALSNYTYPNFTRFFPTLLGSFQLQSILSNSFCSFQRQTFQLKLSNFSFFPTALFNYTYPKKSNLSPVTQD